MPGVAAATSGGNVETGDAVSPALHLAVDTCTSGPCGEKRQSSSVTMAVPISESAAAVPHYGDLLGKGPCRESEKVYKEVKLLYKRLKSLCSPTDNPPDVTLEDCILLSDNPPLAGIPPGRSGSERVEETQQELWRVYNRLRASDRAAGGRAEEFHLKLVSLTRKVEIFFVNQKRQERLDLSLSTAREAFYQVLDPKLFDGVMTDSSRLSRIKEVISPFLAASATANELAGESAEKAILLVPTENGWRGAIAAAKTADLLPLDFPEFDRDSCLTKVAALEIRSVARVQREGVKRVETHEGVLRLLTLAELEALKTKRCGDDLESSADLQIIPVGSFERERIFMASWVRIPFQLGTPAEALLQAELLEVGLNKSANLVECVKDLSARWRWFLSTLADFFQRRRRYSNKVLNLYLNFEAMISFPHAYIQLLSYNLRDQVVDPELKKQMGELFGGMLERIGAEEGDLIRQCDVDEEDSGEEDEDLGDGIYEGEPGYLEVMDNHSRQPARPSAPPLSPLPPPVEHPGQGSPRGLARARGLQDGAGAVPPQAPSRSRARHPSDESTGSGEVPGPGSPAPTTASQCRGDGRTDTMRLQMQRARTVLQGIPAHPDSSKYKNQRSKVEKALEEAERHLREDEDVSASYEEFLSEEMGRAEEVCALKDEEYDLASKDKRQDEEEKRNLLATLPRGLGQKFSGKAQDWPTFRKTFERIQASVDPSLAVKHMINLIADPALQKRLQIYTSGEAIIKELNMDLGHSFLTCTQIVNELNQRKKATTKKEENDLISAFKHAKRTLDQQTEYESLLNISQLLRWSSLLLPRTYEEVLKLAHDLDYGRTHSVVEPFFKHLEEVYSRNGVAIKQEASLTPHADKGGGNKREVGFVGSRVSSVSETAAGCGHFCSTGDVHPPHNCPRLVAGKVKLGDVKKAKLCTCCVATNEMCKKGKMNRRDGSVFLIACTKCKISKRIPCHQKCKTTGQRGNVGSGGGGNQGGGGVEEAPVPVSGTGGSPPAVTNLRTEMTTLANPLKLGSACEIVDYARLQAPDGTLIRVRTFYDSGGTDSLLDYRLSRFFHHHVPVTVGINGSNSSRTLQSHVGDLKLLKSDGSAVYIKAVKGDLSGEGWRLKKKFVDVPAPLQSHFGGTIQDYNEVGDLRIPNVVEDFQVKLVIGLDVCTLFPYELGRWSDNNGQLVMYRSLLSSQVIVTGARMTGSMAPGIGFESNMRNYVITEENETIQLLRTSFQDGSTHAGVKSVPADTRDLFVQRKNLTKVEQKLFKHIEDGDQLVPPQPELCHSCKGCQICSDPFKARREKAVIRLMDQLVTFKQAPREEKGGYHIKLLYDTDLLPRVAVGKEAALKRLLATEKQLSKPGMEAARSYFNEKVQRCRDNGYLLSESQAEGLGLGGLQKAYMPYSFALKDEENLDAIRNWDGLGKDRPGEGPASNGKTKARPVVDCSAAAPGFLSLNQAQYNLPDVHTWRLTEILLKLRTAKHFCIGDLKEFYWQLWVDSLTSSMTRVLFREGGLGSGGEVIELISPVSSMGEKQVSTFAAHVRYRVSESIREEDPCGADQLRGSYMDDIITLESYLEAKHQGSSDEEPRADPRPPGQRSDPHPPGPRADPHPSGPRADPHPHGRADPQPHGLADPHPQGLADPQPQEPSKNCGNLQFLKNGTSTSAEEPSDSATPLTARVTDEPKMGEVLIKRARLIEDALARAHLHLGERWICDLPQEQCPENMIGVAKDSEEVEVSLGGSVQSSALGYRLHLGPDQPEGGALLWRVHRPKSLNLEPKFRGARPMWSQLASPEDIRTYLKEHGVTKSSLLSLTSNLFDPLLLAAPFVSSARQLFRQVLREVSLPSWKSKVPEVYFDRIACLAEDLLEVAKKLKVPRRAITPSPVKEEERLYPYGFTTLLVICDGSMHAGVAAAYAHQQFPAASADWPESADFSGVQVTCNLLCSALKLTEPTNQGQVEGELLAVFIGCQLKDFIVKSSLVKYHQIRICSDSLTVLKCIRKTDTAFSTWASKRIASIQHSVDIDETYHVPHVITDNLVDSATKPQKRPSKFLDERWFQGKGVIDIPMQLIPFTERSLYSQPRMDDLPSQWLSSAARTLLGLRIPVMMTMRLEVNGDELPEPSILERLAERYRDVGKAITTLQLLLKVKKSFRELPAPAQREACVLKFVGGDYGKIKSDLKRKLSKVTQELVLQEDKKNQVFNLIGRYHYRARLLANPKVSSWSRLVLRDAHDKNHLTAAARILAKVGRKYLFTGGATAFLDRLRIDCTMCTLLRPHAVSQLMGNVPLQMRGPLQQDTSTWKYQSIDLFGPWAAIAYPKARGTRTSTKRLKLFVLLVFDYSSRAVEAQICESYSTDSVLVALRAVWARTGVPTYLSFDAAANLSSAGALLGGEEGRAEPTVAEGEHLHQQLRRRLGNRIEMRPHVAHASWRQGAVERSVAFCKRKIMEMLHDTAGGLLTPLQASSLLTCSVAYVNERPLVLHSSPDTMGTLAPWYLTARSISVTHSGVLDTLQLEEDRLTERAVEAQRRLQRFKKEFDVFYLRKLIKFGKWNHNDPVPRVGSVCLILDKEEGKRNFLQKFRLGRISKFLSEHLVELHYVRQDPEVTSQLLKNLRAGADAWRSVYKVKTLTCTRDLKAVAVLTEPQQEQQAPVMVDVLLGEPQRDEVQPQDQDPSLDNVQTVDPSLNEVKTVNPPLDEVKTVTSPLDEVLPVRGNGKLELANGRGLGGNDLENPAPAAGDVAGHEGGDGSVDLGQPLPAQQKGWRPVRAISLEREKLKKNVDWSRPPVPSEPSQPETLPVKRAPRRKVIKEKWFLKK